MLNVWARAAMRALALFVLAFASQVSAADWSGTWTSDYGELRLIRDGDRLYGDYAERGTIEGLVFGRKDELVHAIFMYTDGRWGTVLWRRDGDRLNGRWNWSANGLPANSPNKWSATRTSAQTSPLKYADAHRVGYPFGDVNFTEGPFQSWLETGNRPVPQPATEPNRRDNLSALYGGYVLSGLDQAFAIEADVLHFRGARTAAVDFSVFVNRGEACPTSMHLQFCNELRSLADGRGYVAVRSTGTTIVNLNHASETVETTFRLPGDRDDRLLRLHRDGNSFHGSIHHRQRGLDYEGVVRTRPHLCEQTACQNAVFADLRANPARYQGNVDRGAILRMINGPNRIAQSHGRSTPAPNPGPVSNNGAGPRPLFTDAWAILEETGDNLGEIAFSLDGDRLAASGKLRGFFETAEDHDVVFTLSTWTSEAVAFDLVVYAGQSGESKQGRLLVELPSSAPAVPRGTLFVEDEILLVELVRPTNGLSPREVFDTPAIGIYGVSYRLHNVPQGRTLRLREKPDRNAAVTGSITANASGLTMLGCDERVHRIDSLAFERADMAARTDMLSRTWCQISNGQIAGWLPGLYLSPEAN
ncbi:hypothetical protein [Jannaschia aquimarina]|nr:hypothetical protein [Jannaschia aquimarina]